MAIASPIEGTPTPEQLARFWRKVRKTTSCWIWTAAKKKSPWNDNHYGTWRYGDRTVYAHRFSLFLELGVDPGPSVDHLCYNTLCVRPDHLRGGTIAENNATRRYITAEHCAKGHERTAESTYVSPDGKRQCRLCQQEAWRKSSKKKHQAEKAAQTHTSEPRSKLSLELAREIRRLHAEEGLSQRDLAKRFGVSQPCIGGVLRGETWRDDAQGD